VRTIHKVAVSITVLLGFAGPAFSDSTVIPPSVTFGLVGATFDDGGTATGEFAKYPQIAVIPLPEFYDIQIRTTAGSNLPGSTFVSSNVCYNNFKLPVCAPNSNFLISLETGVPGQPGYDHFQIATYFAPNALVGQIGMLDPTFSYETACTQTGCLTRHISAGAIRFEAQ